MKSKAYIRFLNRVVHFDADLELADALDKLASSQKLTGKLIPTVDATRHPRLAGRKVSAHNRNMACRHLNNTLRAAYIKDVYEELSHYITSILRGAAEKGLDGARLIGNHKFEVDANTLISLGSWDAVLDHISVELFRKLEALRSTPKLIKAFGDKLNLEFDTVLVDQALPYIDLRHVLVHRDGVIDREFAAKHPQLGLNEGDDFSLKYSEIVKARDAIVALVEHFDSKVIQNNIIPTEQTQP